MRERWFFLVAGGFALSACALVADLGDRTLGDPTATEPPEEEEEPDPPTEPPPKSDAKAPPTGDLPPFCDGIVIYASFDGTMKADKGASETFSTGGVSSSEEGKFGGALALVGENANLNSPGAAHWLLGDDGASAWPENTGSFAVWFRSAPGDHPPRIPVLYRPVGSPPESPALQTAGLAFFLVHADVADQIGLYQRAGGDPVGDRVLTFGVDQVASFLRTDDYNHYFSAWDRNGSTKAFMAVNGGTGETFDGTDPGTFPEGEAPFRASSSQAWVSEARPLGVRLGGVGPNSPQGLYDDLVVWNRVLSFAEVAAVHANAEPLGDTCKLR